MLYRRIMRHISKLIFTLIFSMNISSVFASTQLLVIDSKVPDFKQLLTGLPENTEYIVLNPQGNAFEQIANHTAKKPIDSIHIVSHADPGELSLSGANINGATIHQYQADLAAINSNLKDGADILFYGCNLAATENGQSLMSLIAEKTGTNVAASKNKTGHASLGGDWDLEHKVGHVKAEVLFSSAVQNTYEYTLAHFRGGSISWRPIALDGDGLFNDVKITVKTACAIGRDDCDPTSLSNPDGISSLTFVSNTVTDLSDYHLNETVFTGKNLDPDTSYSVFFSSCCRISALKNNSQGNWKIQTTILMKDGNVIPSIDLPIVFEVPLLDSEGNRADSFSFSAKATDGNADKIIYRLANEDELGGAGNGYTNPIGISVDANTGVVTWDYTVLPANPEGLYSAGFVAEDLDANGIAKSKSHVDLILDLQNKQITLFTPDESIPESRNIIVEKGDNFAFTILGTAVNVTSLGNVEGALTEGAEGNFVFEPGNVGGSIDLDPGTYPITFEVRDSTSTTTTSYLTLNFIVPNPNAPKIANIENDLSVYSSTFAIKADELTDAVVTDLDLSGNPVNHLNNGFIRFNVTFTDGQYETLDIQSDGDGPGQIRRTDYEVFYEGSKIADIDSFEDGVGQGLRLDFGTVSLEAIQALVRNLTYSNSFVVRTKGQRNLSLFIQDADGLNRNYSLYIDVQDHPDKPQTGEPVVVNNNLTITSGVTVSMSSENITFADADNTAAQLTISVTNLTNGQFEFVNNPGVAITSFTQEQVNNSLLQFVHGGSANAPTYSLTASDGANAFGPDAAIIDFSNGSIDYRNIFENKIGVTSVSSANVSGTPSFAITGAAPDNGAFVINASSGSLAFSTAPNFEMPNSSAGNNSYQVEVTVTGSSSGVDVRTINVAVQNVNEAPLVSGTPANTVDSDVDYSFTPTASDPESATLAYSIVNKPSWATFNTSTGELSGTATYLQGGTYSNIEITTSDGLNSATLAPFSITVNSINDAPVANTQTVSSNEDSDIAITLSASDSDSHPLTYTVVSAPSNGVLSGTAPNVTYTPNSNYFGADSFTFKANDGALDSNEATITIDVVSVNDLPTANAQTIAAVEDVPKTITLTGSDIDGTIVSYAVGTPTHGTLSGTAPNITYSPNENYFGTDSFTFTVTDNNGGSSVASTISLNVASVNDAPIANTQNVTVVENIAKTITLVGTDVDGTIASYAVNTPGNGTLSGAAPNLNYSPNANFFGSDSFTFTVTDNNGANSSVSTISVTILEDLDGDGTPDITDTDDDGDGISDAIEGNFDSDNDGIPDAREIDSDNDGIHDADEGTTDTDGDGTPDYRDTDSDNDGISDADEGVVDTDSDSTPDYKDTDSDNDGISDADEGNLDTDTDGTPDYKDLDSDSDGILDAVEGNFDSDGDGILDAKEVDADNDGILDADEGTIDSDGDEIADYRDTDSDNDGISDAIEGTTDSDNDGIVDYKDLDSDNDGISDADEGGLDTDGDGILDFRDLDSDNDGISDADEGNFDSDGDGILDAKEVDADNDGILDTDEGTIDSDGDGILDYRDTDSDNDGISDATEGATDSDNDGIADYKDLDSDNDGISDADEGGLDTDGDGILDFRDLDSDNDGISDADEGNFDSDGDGILDAKEVDADNDGILDADEGAMDSDGDGVPDYRDTDSDNDGISDADEGNLDTDGDGIPDYRDLDSDNDGISDEVEGNLDSDGDGIPDSKDTDSDNDGISDADEGTEDTDKDGVPDYLDNGIDEDFDGIPDIVEGTFDFDNDGLPNHLDIDSDNDGLIDGFEAMITGKDTDNDGIDDLFDVDQNTEQKVTSNAVNQFLSYFANNQVVANDTNNDGIIDDVTLIDTDGDGFADLHDADSDNDLLPDALEAVMVREDLDSDGITDSYDVDYTQGMDADADGIDDRVDIDFNPGFDADNNGTNDALVIEYDHDQDGAADFLDIDSDNDSISDTDETSVTPTDTDGDGIVDIFDIDFVAGIDANADGVVDNILLADTDIDSVLDMHDLDSDNDGLFDTQEAPTTDENLDGIADVSNQLSVSLNDNDGDGVANYRDVTSNGDGVFDIASTPMRHLDLNGDGMIDTTTDLDNDGIDDSVDNSPGSRGSGVGFDFDNDGVAGMLDIDDDNDGVLDSIEGLTDSDNDGVANYLDRDSDNDGLSDAFENNQSPPLGIDTDLDGLDDAWDVDATGGEDLNNDGVDDMFVIVDTDADGIPDRLDTDSDNDGISDIQEQVSAILTGLDSDNDGIDDAVDVDITGGFDSNSDGIDDSVFINGDVDNDGLLNFRDTDSDGDGVLDINEGLVDSDANGIPDYLQFDSDSDGISDGDENGDFNNDGINDRLQDTGKVETGVKGAGSLNILTIFGFIIMIVVRNFRKTTATIIMLFAVMATSVQASETCTLDNKSQQNSCWYVGGGMGVSNVEPEKNNTSWRVKHDQDIAVKLLVGYNLTEHWFAEFSYEDMGAATLVNLNPAIVEQPKVDYSAFAVNAGYWLFDNNASWNVYAKLGLGYLDTTTSKYVEQNHSTQLTLGAGVQWRLNQRWFARANITAYDRDAKTYGFTIGYYFGDKTHE